MSDNAPWWNQLIQLDPELERELDAFWAEEQERTAAEKHTPDQGESEGEASTHTEAPPDVTLRALLRQGWVGASSSSALAVASCSCIHRTRLALLDTMSHRSVVVCR